MVRTDERRPPDLGAASSVRGPTPGAESDPGGPARSGDVAVLVLCAIEDVAIVEDALGRDAGAEIVTDLLGRLRASLRPGDTILRPSEDEIAVVVVPVAPGRVDPLVERIVTTVRQPMEAGFLADIAPTVSVGVALGDVDALPPVLVRDARAALRRARSVGPGTVGRFDAGMRAAVEDRLWLEADLRRALHRDELTFHYQPELYLASGELFGFEALSRWQHPVRGPISPDRFIPVVESTGHAALLFARVLRQALDAQTLWSADLGWRPAVAVNLSPVQLGDPTLVEVVARELARARAHPDDLWLELTESALGIETASQSLAALRALGVHLAIDDFGTGYSSLLRLASSEWDAIKIDRAFVARIGRDRAIDEIVVTMIDLAHRLGILTIAEGVETEAQAARLLEAGCDIAQGFLYSPAVPVLDATRVARFAQSGSAPSD